MVDIITILVLVENFGGLQNGAPSTQFALNRLVPKRSAN